MNKTIKILILLLLICITINMATAYIINSTNFNGNTTIMSDPYFFNNENSFSNFTLEIVGVGKVTWNVPLNLSTNIDFNKYVIMGKHSIYINTTNLTMLVNKPASIIMYNITYYNPSPRKDGAACGTNCTGFTLDLSNRIVTFNVTGFSNYSLLNNPIGNLTNTSFIWANATDQTKTYSWYIIAYDGLINVTTSTNAFIVSFMNWSVTYSPGIFGFTILPASSSGTFYPVNQSGVYGTFNITNNENTTINLSVNLSNGLSKYVDLQFYGNNLNYGMVPLYRTPHTGVRTGGQSGSYFNGSQGITSAINITSNSPFTISIWFTNTNKSAQDLIRFYNNSNTVGEIRRGVSDPLQLFSCWVNISGPDNCMSPSYTFSQFDNLTYNYVLAYDGINLTAYLNGTLIDTPNNITQYGTVIYNNTNITSIIIGNGNNYFNGSIYKVQIWNRTLTNVEINSEYLIKMDNPTLLSNGLILQYLLSHTESAFGNTTNVFDVDAATFNQSIQKVSYTDYYDKFNGSVSNVSGNTNETTNYTTEPIQKTVSISRATMAVNVSLTNGTFKLYVNNTLVYNTTNNTPQNVIVDFTTVLRSYLGNCTGPTCSIPLMINETNVTSYTLSNLAIRANGMTGSTNETYITTILPNTTVYVFARAIYTNSGLGGTYTVNWKATK